MVGWSISLIDAPARIALSKETEERKEAIWRKAAEEERGIMKLLMGL